MNAHKRRTAQTMLELIAATVIITIALVPALKMTRVRIANTESLERAETRLALCTSKMEEELAHTAAEWNLNSQTGSFTSAGHAEVRFRVSKSDATSDGGRPGALATIDVTVWHDQDSNGVLDPNEQRVRLATKIAKLVSYSG